MQMNLGKWDLDFDDQILARGRRYYEEGRVLELVRDEDTDTWTADVEGRRRDGAAGLFMHMPIQRSAVLQAYGCGYVRHGGRCRQDSA